MPLSLASGCLMLMFIQMEYASIGHPCRTMRYLKCHCHSLLSDLLHAIISSHPISLQKLVFIRLFELLPLAVAALLHSTAPAHHAALLQPLHPPHLPPGMRLGGSDSNSWTAHATLRPSLRIPRMAEATKEAGSRAQGKAGGRAEEGGAAEPADGAAAAGAARAVAKASGLGPVTSGSVSGGGVCSPAWLGHLGGSGAVRDAAVAVRWADACVAVLHAVTALWREEKRRRGGDAQGEGTREGEERGSAGKRRAEEGGRGRRNNGGVPLWQWARLVVQAGEVLTEAYLRGKGEGGGSWRHT